MRRVPESPPRQSLARRSELLAAAQAPLGAAARREAAILRRELSAAALGHHVAGIVYRLALAGDQLTDDAATDALAGIVQAANRHLSLTHAGVDLFPATVEDPVNDARRVTASGVRRVPVVGRRDV